MLELMRLMEISDSQIPAGQNTSSSQVFTADTQWKVDKPANLTRFAITQKFKTCTGTL